MNSFCALKGMYRRIFMVEPPARISSVGLMHGLGFSEAQILELETAFAADHRRRWYSGEM